MLSVCNARGGGLSFPPEAHAGRFITGAVAAVSSQAAAARFFAAEVATGFFTPCFPAFFFLSIVFFFSGIRSFFVSTAQSCENCLINLTLRNPIARLEFFARHRTGGSFIIDQIVITDSALRFLNL